MCFTRRSYILAVSNFFSAIRGWPAYDRSSFRLQISLGGRPHRRPLRRAFQSVSQVSAALALYVVLSTMTSAYSRSTAALHLKRLMALCSGDTVLLLVALYTVLPGVRPFRDVAL